MKRRPRHAHYDVLTHEETYPDVKRMMAAHRRDFYSVIYLEDQQDGAMQINQTAHQQAKDILFFQSPQHIFSFVRGEAMKGFIVFFKPEFLLPYTTDISGEFSFFDSLRNNVFWLDTNDKTAIIQIFDSLLQQRDRQEVAKHLLLALLKYSQLIWRKHQSIEKEQPSDIRLLNQFKGLVENHFIEQKRVSFYADQLNLTANYLNDKIKLYSGKSAKSHITDRVILEAKNMLLYTELDIAEISFILQFNEPSYFGRFFKKYTGVTPKTFRSNR